MRSSRHTGVISGNGHSGHHATQSGIPLQQPVALPVRDAIRRTREWLLARQHADGYWVGELEGDTILESEYLLLLAFLGQHHTDRAHRCARYLLSKQLPGGGWPIYPEGGVDVSVSVKAYFALKLTGHDPNSYPMQRAREAIMAHGGADAVNSFTRFYLALLGQISYDQCPAVPPEMLLLPKWLPVNIYRMSAWSRTILVPLSIMWAHRPVRQLDPREGIAELFLKKPADWPAPRCPGREQDPALLSWDTFFCGIDRGLKFCERRDWVPLRKRALAKARAWMLERFSNSDGLGAIFPPMIWSIVALKCLGYDDESSELQYCYKHLDELAIEEGDTARLQPCKSPVWDTAITLRALESAGVSPNSSEARKAIDWLLDQEISHAGDWAEYVDVPPSGWCFEHANEHYPDVDDTAMALMALRTQFDETKREETLELQLTLTGKAATARAGRQQAISVDRIAAAIGRGEAWLLAMQNRDGGWGAFDRDNDCQFLCHVPFADHNAMIDPSTPDLAGRVLETLGQLGRKVGQPCVDRAVRFIRRTQEADGSWFGRWGVNYIYGTWQVLSGLAEVGVQATDPAIVAAVNWLVAHQQPSGGWGESPETYAKPQLRGQGPTTASQTAWALLGLMAAGQQDHPAVARGIRYLLIEQRADGTWHEPQFTGTGFPQVFYLRYHMYPIYFPLLALSRWTETNRQKEVTTDAHR